MHSRLGRAALSAALAALVALTLPVSASADPPGAEVDTQSVSFDDCLDLGEGFTFCSRGHSVIHGTLTPNGNLLFTFNGHAENTFTGPDCTIVTKESSQDHVTEKGYPDASETQVFHFAIRSQFLNSVVEPMKRASR